MSDCLRILRWRLLGAALLAGLTVTTACDDKSASKAAKDEEAEKKGDDDGDTAEAEDEEKAEDGVVPAPEKGERPKLTEGAFTRYKSSTGGEMGWSVLEKKPSDRWLLEAKVDQGPMKFVAQFTAVIPDLMKPKGITLEELKVSMNGAPPTVMPTGAGSPVKSVFERFMGSAAPPDFDALPREDVTVPAGTFKGCYKWTQTNTFMGMTTTATIWTHPAVPPPSMVKNESKDGTTFELVEYGTSGAKPTF